MVLFDLFRSQKKSKSKNKKSKSKNKKSKNNRNVCFRY